MSAEHTEDDKVSCDGGTQTLRGRLERFGDPHETWKWETGEVDYVAPLGLTAADVPELLANARQWAGPIAAAWSSSPSVCDGCANRTPSDGANRSSSAFQLARSDAGATTSEGAVALARAGKCTVTALTPYGYKAADVTPQAEAGKITIPMTGENKAAHYEVQFE